MSPVPFLKKGASLWLPFFFSRFALLFFLPPLFSDLSLYRTIALRFFEFGEWPYRDFPFEYPPLALLPIFGAEGILNLFGAVGLNSYRLAFALFVLPFDGTVYYGLSIQENLRNRPSFHPGYLYLLLTTILGILLFDRLDVILMALIATPFLFWGANPPLRILATWFSLGATFKILPAFLAVGLLPLLPSVRSAARLWIVIAAPLLLISGIVFWLSPSPTVSFLQHHSHRGVQVESLVGALCLAWKSFFGSEGLTVVTNYGAQHLSGWSWLGPVSKAIWISLFLVTMAALALFRGKASLLRGTYLLLVSFVAWGYVLSPQFLLWLIPLGLLLWQKEGEVTATLFLVGSIFLTGLHFLFYPLFLQHHWFSLALVNGRNFVLIALYFLLLRSSLRFYESGNSK